MYIIMYVSESEFGIRNPIAIEKSEVKSSERAAQDERRIWVFEFSRVLYHLQFSKHNIPNR